MIGEEGVGAGESSGEEGAAAVAVAVAVVLGEVRPRRGLVLSSFVGDAGIVAASAALVADCAVVLETRTKESSESASGELVEIEGFAQP